MCSSDLTADRRDSPAEDRLRRLGDARDAPLVAERLDLNRQPMPVRRNMHDGVAITDHGSDALEANDDGVVIGAVDARVELLDRGVELLARHRVKGVEVALRQLACEVRKVCMPLLLGHRDA